MLKFISVLYTTGCRGGDVCDAIFEGGSREVWRRGWEGGKFFLKIAWCHLWTTPLVRTSAHRKINGNDLALIFDQLYSFVCTWLFILTADKLINYL